MNTRDPREIADQIVDEHGLYDGSQDWITDEDVRNMLIEAARTALASEPEFAPEGEPDEYRDLWNENKDRAGSLMYFSIPGERPIHVNDEQARHILAYLSEQERA